MRYECIQKEREEKKKKEEGPISYIIIPSIGF
jgi:hypothetical protein